jgi:hypothetical protein
MKKRVKVEKPSKHELWEKNPRVASGDRNTIHVVQRCSKPQIRPKNLGTIRSSNLCTEIMF